MKTTNKKILKKNNLRKTKSLIRLPNNYKPNDKEIFMNAGGKQYNYIPCLNDTDRHVKVFKNIVQINS